MCDIMVIIQRTLRLGIRGKRVFTEKGKQRLWIFPGYYEVDERLPEKTLLQRKLKKHLLEGEKFGIAKGHIHGKIYR